MTNTTLDTRNSTARLTTDEVAALVIQARQGCQKAEAELFRSHYRLLLAAASSHGLSSDDCADVAQRSWMKARASLHTLRDNRAFRSWISTIARNESISTLRSHKRETAMPIEAIDGTFVFDNDAPMIIREESDCIKAAVARLNSGDKRLMKLLFEDRKNYRQISEELSCPVGSIGPTRARILGRLRQMVERDLADYSLSA